MNNKGMGYMTEDVKKAEEVIRDIGRKAGVTAEEAADAANKVLRELTARITTMAEETGDILQEIWGEGYEKGKEEAATRLTEVKNAAYQEGYRAGVEYGRERQKAEDDEKLAREATKAGGGSSPAEDTSAADGSSPEESAADMIEELAEKVDQLESGIPTEDWSRARVKEYLRGQLNILKIVEAKAQSEIRRIRETLLGLEKSEEQA